MSCSQYCGYEDHIKAGHRVLYRIYIKAPAKVLIWDPCPFGSPVILTVAHVEWAGFFALEVPQ